MTDLKGLHKVDWIVLILTGLIVFSALYLPSDALLVPVAIKGDLVSVVHSNHNAYFQITTLGQWAASRIGSNVLILIGLLAGSAALSFHGISALVSIPTIAAVFGINSALFGDDLLVLGPLSLLPCLYLTIRTATASKLSFIALLFGLTTTSWLLLYSLALPVFLLTILIVTLINKDALEKHLVSIVFLCCVSLFILVAISPAIPWPDYPAQARVNTLIDGPAWLARPLVGIDLQFPTVDRQALEDCYGYLILPLAILLLIIGGIVKQRPVAGKGSLVCALGLALVFIDFKLPEEFAQIAPLRSIPRLLPELSLIPLAPTILSLVVSGLTIIIFAGLLNSTFRLAFGLFAVVGIIYSQPYPKLEIRDLPVNWINSPSRAVTKYFGAEVLNSASSKWRLVKPKAANLKVSSTTEVNPKLFLDKDPATRWVPGAGKQIGNEWLKIELIGPREIIGIKLDTGSFKTDFPRGIRVKAGATCETMQTVSNYPAWQGSPKFTGQQYPYFSAQSDVEIFFPRALETGCLLIEQIGTSDNFDWSVAEFRLIVKEMEKGEEDS